MRSHTGSMCGLIAGRIPVVGKIGAVAGTHRVASITFRAILRLPRLSGPKGSFQMMPAENSRSWAATSLGHVGKHGGCISLAGARVDVAALGGRCVEAFKIDAIGGGAGWCWRGACRT
jgi:hypothetical protein